MNPNFTKEILTHIFELSKILKCDIIYVFNDTIYGSNYDSTILKKVHYPNDIVLRLIGEIEFISKDMQVFIKAINECNDDLIIHLYKIICGDNFICINNPFRIGYLNNIFNKFEYGIHTGKLLCDIDDAKLYMENVLSCRAAEKDLIKIDRNIMLIMHGSMLPINKTDSVSLKVFSYNGQSNIFNIFINKKKKKQIITVEVYMLSLIIN